MAHWTGNMDMGRIKLWGSLPLLIDPKGKVDVEEWRRQGYKIHVFNPFEIEAGAGSDRASDGDAAREGDAAQAGTAE